VNLHPIVLAALTTGVGVVMIRMGAAKGRVLTRATRRRCVSCGRALSTRGCEHCGV
jgi:hypothetical protein